MVSKIFVLGDGDSKSTCVRVFLLVAVLIAVIVAIIVCVYTFKSDADYWPVCPPPLLDENGLSNWTLRSEYVTYACMPGYSLEGNESTLVAHCNLEEKQWEPLPPPCIHLPYLPILLDCNVTQDGFEGRVSIWQEDDASPTHLSGYLNTTNVNRNQTVISELIPFSYSTCSVSHTPQSHLPHPVDCTNVENCLNVRFNSTALIPYKKMEMRVTMVFISETETAIIVSLHQNSLTLVMKTPVTTSSSTSTTTTTSTTTSTSTPPGIGIAG